MPRDWNQRYAEGEAADQPPEPLLVHAIANRTPGRALDLACGRGRNALYLGAQQWDVTAVDASHVALELLSQRMTEGAKIRPVLADLEANEFGIEPASWALIVDCNYLHRPLFPSIRAGIKAGGIFVGVFPMEGINPVFQMHPGELAKLFHGWKVLQYLEDSRARIIAERP